MSTGARIWDVGDVLKDELEVVKARRAGGAAGNRPDVPEHPAGPAETARKLETYYRGAAELDPPLSALCLSGGGIRSAAFALGVLQGLARRGVLDKFDYLSTVSGGGYAGSFLTAWVQRAGFDAVLADLKGERLEDRSSPLRYLRGYSNYLNPRVGLLSSDRLTNVVLYLRNLLLNWLVILPVVVFVVLLAKIVAIVAWAAPAAEFNVTAAFAIAFMGMSFVDSVGQRPGPHGEIADSGLLNFYRYEVLPMLAGAVLASVAAMGYLHMHAGTVTLAVVGQLLVVGALTSLLAALVALYFSRFARPSSPDARLSMRETGWILFAMVMSWAGGASLMGLAMFGAARLPTPPAPLQPDHLFIVLGPPVFILALFIGEVIYVALVQAMRWGDAEREWLARAAGHHLLAAAGWLIVFGLVIVGSAVFFDLTSRRAIPGKDAAAALAAASGIAGAIAALLGRAKETAASIQKHIASWKDIPLSLIMAVATAVFVAALTVVLSAVIDRLLFGGVLSPKDLWRAFCSNWWGLPDGSTGPCGWLQLPVSSSVLVAGGVVVAGLATSYFVNINRFSMHGVYRNRLIRSFLGASHRGRRPNELTDFDTKDNIDLAAIWPGKSHGGLSGPPGAPPPQLVVNMALNVVGSGQLAWQERKAISFTATARWVGAGELEWSHRDKVVAGREVWRLDDYGQPVAGPDGAPLRTVYDGFYRRADEYGERLTLGTAMTISGAAVSPNMGYTSSSAYSVLMTLFNVRLGAWYGNPGPRGEPVYRRSGPKLSAEPLVSEALGITTPDRHYVYLSDGGHFENLGIYEMIRRRCRLIVVSDGGEDPNVTFEDLGNAVRRAELDFGAQIRFQTFAITGKVGDATPTFAIGQIRYPEPAGGTGVLLYVKPCRDDRAPLSVRAYAAMNARFPHEPTTDQFFGETQFEAYRALGEYAMAAMAPAGTHDTIDGFLKAIEAAARAAKKKAAAAGQPARPRPPRRAAHRPPVRRRTP